MIDAIILGLVQGITEFLPVSSSGHLVLLHDVFGIDVGGLAFDVALHLGTLLAVALYFSKDIIDLIKGVLDRDPQQLRLAKLLIIATIPAVAFGLFLQDAIESSLRSPWVVVIMLVLFGGVMLAAEHYAQKIKGTHKKPQKLSEQNALLVGFFQACALIPGVSRSGSTISGGLFLGLNRVAATRFSFLLALPVIFGAAAKVLLLDEGSLQAVSQEADIFAVGMITAFLSGMLAISFLLKFVANHSIRSFAYYRFAVAGSIAIILLTKG